MASLDAVGSMAGEQAACLIFGALLASFAALVVQQPWLSANGCVPGLKLAALPQLYEFFFDTVLGVWFTSNIIDRCKFFTKQFGAPHSASATINHAEAKEPLRLDSGTSSTPTRIPTDVALDCSDSDSGSEWKFKPSPVFSMSPIDFGGGARQCLGRSPTHAELFPTLAKLFRRWADSSAGRKNLDHRKLDDVGILSTSRDCVMGYDCFIPSPKKGSRELRFMLESC